MRRVRVVTDTTACLPPHLAASRKILVLPLELEFEDAVYQDGISATSAEFYAKLAASPRPPTTSSPSPGVYADAFLEAGRDADAVLCVTVSRQFSAMYDAAVQGRDLARERAPELDVRVLDSGAAAMAQGFVALEAARGAADGAAIDDVITRATALMPHVQLLVSLDTLTYVGRSGRVPRLLIMAASPLRIKPVVAFERGAYRPIGLARTAAGASGRLLGALRQRAGAGELHVCVHHTNAPAEAEALRERVREALSPKELLVSEFTQLMGVHTGPGLLGFAFYSCPE